MKKTPQKLPVTLRALLARINRKLAHDGLELRTSRSAAEIRLGGAYYIVDTNVNQVHLFGVNPEEYARKIGALAAWEELAGE